MAVWSRTQRRRRGAADQSREQVRERIETGVVVARLETVVDRLEGAYDRLDRILTQGASPHPAALPPARQEDPSDG